MAKASTLYHIPVCPFSQRLEILLELKGVSDALEFEKIDITVPRPSWLLELTGGTTALPVLVTQERRVLKESLVLLQYLEDVLPGPKIARQDPYERALENLMVTMEAPFNAAGYTFVMNQDQSRRASFEENMLSQYQKLNDFLMQHNPGGTWLFDKFGWVEAVYTPFFMRFWFLKYYENFELPQTKTFERVRRWQDACMGHPAAQQVTEEEVVKVYYDYALGAGNGALVPGRQRSSFVFEPDWRGRPWPPREKYGTSASDSELGLV